MEAVLLFQVEMVEHTKNCVKKMSVLTALIAEQRDSKKSCYFIGLPFSVALFVCCIAMSLSRHSYLGKSIPEVLKSKLT